MNCSLPQPIAFAKLTTALVLGAMLCSGCGSSNDEQSAIAGSRLLWSRDFVAISVESGDSRSPVAEPSSVHVSFSDAKGGQIEWNANCNSFGSPVRVTAGRLKLSEIGTTLVGCGPEPEREDEWLADFFGSDPSWRLLGTHLTLSSGGGTMELEES